MKKGFCLFMFVLFLGGCAKVLMENEEGITLSGPRAAQGKIYAIASAHCQKYGKSAVLTLKDRNVHSFQCK